MSSSSFRRLSFSPIVAAQRSPPIRTSPFPVQISPTTWKPLQHQLLRPTLVVVKVPHGRIFFNKNCFHFSSFLAGVILQAV